MDGQRPEPGRDVGAAEDVRLRPATSRELKFRSLAAELRRSIVDGTWPPGAKLPTEQALATEMELSVTTVRRAYEELAGQGLVMRRQGSGTFVSSREVSRRQGQRVVGVLVPDMAVYYPRVLKGIEQALSTAHARMVLASSENDQSVEDAKIDQLIQTGVHGLLLAPALHKVADPSARMTQIQALPVPVVMVERRLALAGPGDRSEHVCTDHEGGAWDAVRHLRDLGHRRIALVLRTDGPASSAIFAGYQCAVDDFGLPPVPPQADVQAAWDAERADAAVAAFVGHEATGVLCFGDREALKLLGAARRAGVRVPDDLAIVTYDNEFADVGDVPLTAMSPPKFRLGQLAAEVLLRRLEAGDAMTVHQLRLRPRLIVRSSCGARLGANGRRPAR